MPIVDREKGALRPVAFPIVLRAHQIENDGNPVLVVLPHKSLVSIRGIRSHYSYVFSADLGCLDMGQLVGRKQRRGRLFELLHNWLRLAGTKHFLSQRRKLRGFFQALLVKAHVDPLLVAGSGFYVHVLKVRAVFD